MSNLINEEKVEVDGRLKTIQYFSDGSKIEIVEYNNVIRSKKEIRPDGSYCVYNVDGIKIEELTSDEVFIKYNSTPIFLPFAKYFNNVAIFVLHLTL